MTNDPETNMVIASQINSDGTLTPISATATGGAGSAGIVTPPAAQHPDALFSQDSVKVFGENLFVVNGTFYYNFCSLEISDKISQKAGDATLSMFAIDPEDPTSIELIANEPTGGDFPTSVAVSKDGELACALNGGLEANFMCFAVGNGSLTALPNTLRTLGVNQTSVRPTTTILHTSR